MEEILKFTTSEQSIRSQAFMFLWRILLAIILTNKYMNMHSYNYDFINFSFKEGLNFIFCIEFLFVVSIYLIYIFIFFWAVRFFLTIILLFMGNGRNTSDEKLDLLFWGFIRKRNLISFFRDRSSLEAVQILKSGTIDIITPLFNFVINRLNVLLANSVLIHTFIEVLETNNLYNWMFIGLFMLNDILLICAIVALLLLGYFHSINNRIEEWILTTSRRGFFVN